MPEAHNCDAWPLADGRILHTCSACGSWALDHPPTLPCEADIWHAGYEAGYRMGLAAERPGAVQLRVQREISERLAAKVMVLERTVLAVANLPRIYGSEDSLEKFIRATDLDAALGGERDE